MRQGDEVELFSKGGAGNDLAHDLVELGALGKLLDGELTHGKNEQRFE